MAVDERPARSVLFLGNSRTFVNDLPGMVRVVADSAHSPARCDIRMRAWGGATFKQHWNDEGDQEALRQHWDLVILQPESGAFGDEANSRDTATYGGELAREAQEYGSRVAIVANWALGANFFSGDGARAATSAKHYADKIGRETRAIAAASGADVIDLEGAFAEAARTAPDVVLTPDGNHPSPAGTYLAALMIYAALSHADPTGVGWRPQGVSDATAAQFKAIAARYQR